ncbi:hypothetical protein [Massilia sp. Leaf139]|uniref:hypothetical protein n=1 Tax=Massilia sp. Leaf139 TaxID=1736272 RepID=UPI000ABF61B2|nr:hypothetical protein [Massilia sp. Leaf139]
MRSGEYRTDRSRRRRQRYVSCGCFGRIGAPIAGVVGGSGQRFGPAALAHA